MSKLGLLVVFSFSLNNFSLGKHIENSESESNRVEKSASRQVELSSSRLMKELSRAHKSKIYKNGLYTIELVNENLFEWDVKLSAAFIDADSRLHKELVALKEKGRKDQVELRFLFSDHFPFMPPFVRLVYPVLSGGHVMNGGAICLELLSPQVSWGFSLLESTD